MTLIHYTHHIGFSKSDPLGGGLREEIEQEQDDPSAIVLGDEDGSQLMKSWEQIASDVEKDPDWFTFTDDDEAA